MQNILLILLVAAVIGWAVWRVFRKAKKGGGCCGEFDTVSSNPVADRNKAHYPYDVTLHIGGMTCENCARRVENALNELDGVWASVSIDSHLARVRCKRIPDETALREAVRSAGYVVTGCEKKGQ